VTVWISESLRARSGALGAAAQRFLQSWLGTSADGFRGGAAGLRALSEHLEHWLELEPPDVLDDEDERQFVEGAGALLGLMLIDHVGDGAYVTRAGVHRVRLGRYGYFDPFAAIDRVLDAPDVRRELARQVAVAEAEASARGPISRLVHALVETLSCERPDLQLEDHFDLTLQLRAGDERVELDLQRAVESTSDQSPAAVQSVARKLLSMLPGAPETPSTFDDVRTRLVPRLARADALRELESRGPGQLFAAPLTAELVVSLLVEYDGRARYVRAPEVERWGLSPPDALTVSLDNLALRSTAARITTSETEHGPLLVARTGDGRDSARVLLSSLYGALSARLGERVYVSIPHRDTFFACGEASGPLRDELARRTAHDAARAPHRLSTRVFQLTASGVSE
jgi:uncharacterized protein YtpQ (UPF0354 family)